MNLKGTYVIKEYFNFTIEVDYEYYHKAPTHEDPFEDRLDIKRVRLNDIDITQFYWDYLNEDMFEKIYEYVTENKREEYYTKIKKNNLKINLNK